MAQTTQTNRDCSNVVGLIVPAVKQIFGPPKFDFKGSHPEFWLY